MSHHLVRPRTIVELQKRLERFVTAESIAYCQAFQPLPTDVFITPFPKSGTTWMQQIVHGLRARGSMAFREISEVIPWMELAYDMNIDLSAEQEAEPRAFKSHLSWDQIPQGGRYINIIRDPKDVLISMYHFLNGWFFETNSISLSEYAWGDFLRSRGPHDYWWHLRSWWPHRDDENVLFLCYEDMRQDVAPVIRQVANFIGCALDDDLFEVVRKQSSFEFMRAHQNQFDDSLLREARNHAWGLPPSQEVTKVRTGRVGDHLRELSWEVTAALDQAWSEEINASLGFSSYDALRTCLKAEKMT